MRPKICFSNPPKGSVVILDANGSEIVARMVLGDIEHVILPARGEVIYCTLPIILNFLRQLHFLCGEIIRTGRLWGSVYRVYLLACLLHIGPRVVITFVDNSSTFHWLSLRNSGAVFVAIQNGTRNRYTVKDFLPKRPSFGSVISIPHYFCFGQYEIDLFTRCGHEIEKFYPVGSLRGGYYLERILTDRFADIFDLCLVSEWVPNNVNSIYHEPLKEAILKIYKNMQLYQSNKNIKLCVALRSDTSEEREYFEQIFDRDVYFMSFDLGNMSTYRAMNASKIVVTGSSTAALEAFGWGKKVLFCNYMNDDEFDYPAKGLCLLTDPSYEALAQRLDDLFLLEAQAYSSMIMDWQKYRMNYSFDNLPHHVIKNMILDWLNPI